jgi:hypothetical protein
MVGWLVLRPCVSTPATGTERRPSLDDRGEVILLFVNSGCDEGFYGVLSTES